MLQLIGNTIENVLDLFFIIVEVTTKIGLLLAYILQYMCDVLFTISSTIYQCAKIFYEELERFIDDLDNQYSHGATALHNAFVNSVASVLRAFCKLSTNINNLSETIKLAVQNTIQNVSNQFAWTLTSIGEFAILIGDSVWMLIMLIPNMLIFCSMKLALMLAAFINGVIAAIKSSATIAVDNILSFLSYFTTMPMQSALGLLSIGIAIKYRRITLNAFFILLHLHLIILSFFLTRIVRILSTIYRPIEIIITFFLSILRLRRRTSYMLDPISDQGSDQETITDNKDDNGNLCVICQDRRKSVVLLPCRHLCLCQNCSINLKRYRTVCPLCRKSFRDAIQVYV